MSKQTNPVVPQDEITDVLVLHGMSLGLVNDIELFLRSLGLKAETVEEMASRGNPQDQKVSNAIENCRLALVLLTFDETEQDTSKARPNVYDEISTCKMKKPNDTILLREVKDSKKVTLPSNKEGTLVELTFEMNQLHKLYPQLIKELKGRNMVSSKIPLKSDMDFNSNTILRGFLDKMDRVWEEEFDKASNEIYRGDYYTMNKFQLSLDRFFLEYWKVFNALVRQNEPATVLKKMCEDAAKISDSYAVEIWEDIADAKMKAVDELKAKRSKDKKFDGRTFNKYYQEANGYMNEARSKYTNPSDKIKNYRSAVAMFNTIFGKFPG